ncbi:serine protease inhibitor 42Dd-like [Eriocheir sinensis]|uniref:serine protease inhibitor 42Dd-like n=1 Tax=Eriocheir sinensis TaxID=95602 RepID=UPI0021C5BE03|nr:serine protease inhibitor 42Dd-like [Eriocheir sinensis]
MAAKSLSSALSIVLLAVALVCGQGQQQSQQQGQQQGRQVNDINVCFPGEGELRFTTPDPAFPPTVEQFSYSLFRTLSAATGEKSAIMSPYSIWSVLSLAYFGSMGSTQREIETALNFANKTHALSNWRALRFFLEGGAGDAELGIANRGYFSMQLRLNRCLTSNIFDLRLVDFTKSEETRRQINKDVSDTTRGRIPELITFLPPQTRLALVNAIYFKGTWASLFDATLTRPQEFLVPPGRSSGVVQMMTRQDVMSAGEAAGLDSKMIELPYRNSSISMFLLLPNDPRAPISSMVARLNPTTFVGAVRELAAQPQIPVTLSMPKFTLTTRYEDELKSALFNMGVKSLFDPSRADLTGFATAPPLHVDTAIHQATVEVNEEGTVAAGATAFINTRFGPQKTLNLTFNRPFVFLIVDKRTRLPLFIGKVTSAADLEKAV